MSEITPKEANLQQQPEIGPDRLGVRGLPAGEGGATGKLNLDAILCRIACIKNSLLLTAGIVLDLKTVALIHYTGLYTDIIQYFPCSKTYLNAG